MAVGKCWCCGEDTHIEQFPGRHIAEGPFGPEAWLCFECEALEYRAFYDCPHRNRRSCVECEAKKEVNHQP